MLLKKRTLPKWLLTTGLKTACSILALTAGLAAGSVQAADQGTRYHARGQYDTATATYGMSASITSTPTSMAIRPGSPTWTRNCGPCSSR